MMRLASALLVAVLLTTCTISGTFAKYVTTASATDTARVAKWGVTVEATGNDAFAPSYEADTAGVTSYAVFSNADLDHDSFTDDVLAPGTSGHLGKLTIKGKPEVMVDVLVSTHLEIDGDWAGEWKIDADDDPATPDVEYCPIVFTVNGVTYGTKDTNATNRYDTINELETYVELATTKLVDTIPANTDLAGTYDFDIYWEWPFEVGTPDAAGIYTNDIKDTKLGNFADDYPLTIKFYYDVSVTQVD